MLVAGLVAGAIMTFAITYPLPGSVGTFTSVSTTTDTVIATSVSTTTSTTTQTTTLTSTFDPTKALTDTYLSHIGAIESRNAPALASQYETNATLQYSLWTGTAELTGGFDGVANITRFYEGQPTNTSQAISCVTCIALKAPFAVANETHSIIVSSDDKAWNVTSHLVFYGTISYGGCYVQGVGPCNTQYYAMGFDISYVLQGDRWLISTESLSYINNGACTTAYSSPDGSVFCCQFTS